MTYHLAVAAAICLVLTASSTTQAIEVQVGNRAQSMGQAFTAVADDPSAVLHNPAGLTQIPNTEIDVGLSLNVINLDYTDATGVTHPADENVLVPTLFASTDTLNPVVVGIGFYVPWGSKAELAADAASAFPYLRSELVRYDLTLAAAYQFNEVLSAGIGFTTGYARVKNDVPVSATDRLLEDADGFGFSGVAGVLWTPASWFKAGLNYRGPMQVSLSGDATLAGIDDTFTTDLNFPGTLSAGIAVIPIEDLTVSFDFDWTHWQVFEDIVRDYATLPTTTQPINGTDAHDYRIGFEYRAFEKTHFRAGYSYQENGWPAQTVLPSELDHTLHVISAGLSQFVWKMRIDLAYEFSTAVGFTVTDNINGFNGDYDGIRHIALLTTAFKF